VAPAAVAGVRHRFCDLRNVAMGKHLVVVAIPDAAFPLSVKEA